MVQTRTKNYGHPAPDIEPSWLDVRTKEPGERIIPDQKSVLRRASIYKNLSASAYVSGHGRSRSGNPNAPIIVEPVSSSPLQSQASDRSSPLQSVPENDPGNDSPPSNGGGPWPGPAVIQCDDFGHCGTTHCTLPLRQCLWRIAPQAGVAPAPGNPAGQPHNALTTCGLCRAHRRLYHLSVIRKYAKRERSTGFRARLCRDCERDEAKLYWDRHLRPMPWTTSSLQDIVSWPSPQNQGNQDLCICVETVNSIHFTTLGGPSFLCCGCRDKYFLDEIVGPQRAVETMLINKKKALIKGDRRLANNASDKISQSRYNNRYARRIGRACPCGNESEPIHVGQPRPYIVYCQACMGVRIDGQKLPPDLLKDRLAPRRNVGTRNGTRWGKTKGPQKAPRHPDFRVNIERGWLKKQDINDDLIDGI
ncbi:uncharacterized protein CC84DRAFT_1246172 [Paraphaeosphaeria sporulosa]|uniref:Uncharacterized protein n=1 Tax=Paraphaeosphaeria sporulosa TaxID=1460663 RepID=A0A177CI94_9PLEO|nr:uncharacterized protein CC84DRAFT_1246172 [Paraphaeosphaeria sporulosa]OAG06550.1 hypothetical protein CC84DRAFT_1246172 [Paraphaeosphaeria sporulosa]